MAALPVAAPLALKVAVAAGSIRRLLVGDPAVQGHDVFAGPLLARLGAAEQQAQAGGVVLDPATAARLAARLPAPARRGAPLLTHHDRARYEQLCAGHSSSVPVAEIRFPGRWAGGWPGLATRRPLERLMALGLVMPSPHLEDCTLTPPAGSAPSLAAP